MKIVVIVVALLALLGGGTFAAVTFAPALVPAPVRDLLGVEVPEIDPDAPAPRPTNTTMIEIEPLTIPIIQGGAVDRFLVIHVLLEVESGEKAAYVTAQLPRIIDLFITHIHALAGLNIAPGIADRQFLKERLLAKIDETIGKGYVVDMLFSNLFERPLG